MNDPANDPANATELPERMPPPERVPQTAQVLAVFPDLVQDLRDALRNLPYKDADSLLKRLGACQVMQVQINQQS